MATSNILAGQEITLSYLEAASEGSDGKDKRQGYMRLYYGFQCKCRACCLEGEELALDESVRSRVRGIQVCSRLNKKKLVKNGYNPNTFNRYFYP